MTWSYTNPSASDKDAVRYLVGDTDTTDQQTTDEEITWVLTEESNIYLAGARVAKAISATYARKADKSVGDLRISFKSTKEHYEALAANLEARGATRAAAPYAGGISKTDKETVEEDTDRVEPAFEIGVHDYPGGIYETNRDPINEV